MTTAFVLASPSVLAEKAKKPPEDNFAHTWSRGGPFLVKAFRTDLQRIAKEIVATDRHYAFFCTERRCARIFNYQTSQVIAEVKVFAVTGKPDSMRVQLVRSRQDLHTRFKKFAPSRVGSVTVEIVDSL